MPINSSGKPFISVPGSNTPACAYCSELFLLNSSSKLTHYIVHFTSRKRDWSIPNWISRKKRRQSPPFSPLCQWDLELLLWTITYWLPHKSRYDLKRKSCCKKSHCGQMATLDTTPTTQEGDQSANISRSQRRGVRYCLINTDVVGASRWVCVCA